MKKIYFLLLLAMVVIQTNAQKIIITGAMVQTGDVNSGGTEYIQLMATEDISASELSNHCLIVSRIDANRLSEIGWKALTSYQFNFDGIAVNKGEFFYVGGTRKALRITDAGLSQGDFSTSKWARSKDYRTEPGDLNNGAPQGEIKNNGNIGLMNNNRANIIGVFNTKNVNANTRPIDMVVICNDAVNVSGIVNEARYQNFGTEEEPNWKGYPVPVKNDHYDASIGHGYFNGKTDVGTQNTFFFDGTNSTHSFQKFGGLYNEGTGTWTTPRSKTAVAIPASPTIALIEAGTGVTTLPVTLTNFTAKAQTSSIVLNWTTESEQNNARFDIYRSIANNSGFEKIGSITGNGTSNQSQTYSYTDNHPQAGVNYYQLVQVDNDGNTNLLGNTFVNVGLKASSLSVSASGGIANLFVYTAKGGIGKAYLYNIYGHRIGGQRINLAKGYTTITFPVQLQKNSVYVAGIETQTEHLTVKFLN